MTDDKKVVDLAHFREKSKRQVKRPQTANEEIDASVTQFVFEFMEAIDILYEEIEEITDRHHPDVPESDRDIMIAANIVSVLASVTAIVSESHCATRNAALGFAKSVSDIAEEILQETDTYDDKDN